jgi:hypothetical protein
MKQTSSECVPEVDFWPVVVAKWLEYHEVVV